MRRVVVALFAVLLAAPASAGASEWLAGDGHVHTCYSHDAWCLGESPQPETLYSNFGSVAQRFDEGARKGLDFLVVSDHNTTAAWADPAFGTKGVIGVHAYENSTAAGHAHMLGAKGIYGSGSGDTLAERAATIGPIADALRADGGLFQANHPAYDQGEVIDSCEDAHGDEPPMHWKLGFAVAPDTIEVWNPTALIQPAELFWECWLARGFRIPALGGSDSHGATQNNVGMPTTWVLSEDRSEAGILAAIRAGRTTISRLPPAAGGPRLVLEGDADGDGTYEARLGDALPRGAAARARVEGLSAPGLLRVRAGGPGGGGQTIAEAPVAPGEDVPIDLGAVPAGGWVRAVLLQQSASADVDPNCTHPHPDAPLSLCTADLAYSALTSPLYVDDAASSAR